MTFITQVLNGLQLGSIYALVALGYTMVYGIILLLNFAHGDIIMVGAYISWLVMSKLGLNPAIAVVLSIVGCMLLGVFIDKVAYAPLRDAPRLSILITAIGVSYFLENGSQLLFGADAKVVPAYTSVSNIQVGDLTLSFSAIVTVVVTAVATVVLTFLVQKTKLGKVMRAVSEDMGAARLMGINVNTTISFTFAWVRRLPASVPPSTAWPIRRQAPPWESCWAPRLSWPRSWAASGPSRAPSSAAFWSGSPRSSSLPSVFPSGRTPSCSCCSSSCSSSSRRAFWAVR